VADLDLDEGTEDGAIDPRQAQDAWQDGSHQESHKMIGGARSRHSHRSPRSSKLSRKRVEMARSASSWRGWVMEAINAPGGLQSGMVQSCIRPKRGLATGG